VALEEIVATKVVESFLFDPMPSLEDFFDSRLEVVVADTMGHTINICVMRSSTISIIVTIADQVAIGKDSRRSLCVTNCNERCAMANLFVYG
jgi:hypothetical protein